MNVVKFKKKSKNIWNQIQIAAFQLNTIMIYDLSRCRCKRLTKPWNLSEFLGSDPDHCVFFTSRQWRHSSVIPARRMGAGSCVRTLVSLHSSRHFAPQLRHQRRCDVIDHRFPVRATCCANEALLLRLVFVDRISRSFCCLFQLLCEIIAVLHVLANIHVVERCTKCLFIFFSLCKSKTDF